MYTFYNIWSIIAYHNVIDTLIIKCMQHVYWGSKICGIQEGIGCKVMNVVKTISKYGASRKKINEKPRSRAARYLIARSYYFHIRSLTPQQAARNALTIRFKVCCLYHSNDNPSVFITYHFVLSFCRFRIKCFGFG